MCTVYKSYCLTNAFSKELFNQMEIKEISSMTPVVQQFSMPLVHSLAKGYFDGTKDIIRKFQHLIGLYLYTLRFEIIVHSVEKILSDLKPTQLL